MTKLFQWRRGTTAEHVSFVGAVGEITVDTDKDTLVVHDGITPGGFPLASEAILGTIATQDANAISITGGSITGIADLAIADGGTGASTAPGARTNLGFGTIATQDADSVSITGGSITGMSNPTLSSDVATKNYVDNEFAILGIHAVKNFAEPGDDFVINNKHQLIVYDEYVVEAGGTLTIDVNAALVVL